MVWMILFFLIAGWPMRPTATAAQQEETAELLEVRAALLEQRYERETGDPRDQAKIAVDLTKNSYKRLRLAYDAADAQQQQQAREAFLDAMDRLETSVASAKHIRTSKDAEVFLRQHGRDLENLEQRVSFFDRADIEKLLERAAALRQEILYNIMNPEED